MPRTSPASSSSPLRPVPMRDVVSAWRPPADMEELEAFFELSTDLLAIASVEEGRWRRVNPAMARTLGWNHAVLLAMPIREILHPDDAESARISLARLAAGGQVRKTELRFRTVGGDYRTIELDIAPHHEKGLAYCVGRDVTDLRAATRAARVSEERLQALFDGLPIGVALFERSGHVVAINPEALRLHGMDSLAASRMPDPDQPYTFRMLDDDGRVLPVSEWPAQRAFRGESVDGVEVWVQRADGSRRRVSYAATPLDDGSGQLAIVFRDVTARVTAEAGRAAMASRFLDTFENAAVGIAHVGLDGRWLRINGKTAELLGRTPAEVYALTFQELTHPDDLEMDLVQTDRLLEGAIPHFRIEKRYLRPDGSSAWAQITVSLARTPEGAPDYYIVVVEDIAERKEAEARLRAALAIKDEFLGLVSHELRTPLTVVYGMSRILARPGLDPEVARETAGDIAASAERLDALVEDLLLLARADTAESRRILTPMDLGTIAARVVERHRLADPGLDLELSMGVGDLVVLGHEAWLERAVDTLLDDAGRHAGRTPVRLHLGRAGDRVRLEVADEGPGIPPGDIETIFEPFYRSGWAGGGEMGLGLGLAVARRIVELLGGTIRAENLEPVGARFTIELPAADAAAEA